MRKMRRGEPVTIDFMGLDTANKNAREKCGVHDLSWIKPQMMQRVLSMRGICDPKQEATERPGAHTHTQTQTEMHSRVPECRSEAAQLTIFYQGTVNVYNVSAEKAKSIFMVAGGEKSNHFSSSEKIKETDRKTTEGQIQKLRGDLPLARKHSLQRFLQKRKHRLMMAAPYSHEAATADVAQP